MSRAARAALYVGGVLILASGCGTADDRDQARASASEFFAALEERDGHAACDHLSPPTADALERQEKASCPEAILDQDLGEGAVASVAVYETDAVVALRGGERAYLDRRAGGWKVSAAGCKLKATGPAECELED